MRLSMDPEVSGYSLKEANKLRKSIAKVLAFGALCGNI